MKKKKKIKTVSTSQHTKPGETEATSLALEAIWFKQQWYENSEAWCQKVAAGIAHVTAPDSACPNSFMTDLQVDIALAPVAHETVWFKQQCYEDAEAWSQKVVAGTAHFSTSRPARPNYFVAVQISNPQISSVAKIVQQNIKDQTNCYDKNCIATEKFHITLMVLNLTTEEEIKRVSNVLDTLSENLLVTFSGQPIELEFEGVSVFGGGRVMYACLKENVGSQRLHHIAGELSKHMEEEDICNTDNKEWHPHLTLWKYQGNKRKTGPKKVSPASYEPYLDLKFGNQVIRSLQLCHMTKKREDGYYFVQHESIFAHEVVK